MYSPLIPFLRYRDVRAAHDWLINAFGFESYDTTEVDGTIVHAELSWRGLASLQLGSAVEDGAVIMLSPLDLPGLNQGVYLYVGEPAEVDEQFKRAVAAGAPVVYEPRDAPYGARDFGVRDLEGHYWSFGSYIAK
ncbi:VOC family protein [Catelliglobosispora koreensis]|uniref:VOC family protein n=1 Tax=Catelliglobosispora koreensis TaxID=129052 RepID=UPI000371BCBF|nr:VOC family protein [Catelliglobosispora koreensis]